MEEDNLLDNPVQSYYVPLPEDDLFETFDEINSVADGDINTVISVAVAADNTIVYYDHWEDGYDPNPNDKVNKQATTEIWGDGDVSNGAAPGVSTDAEDVLQSGDAIVLENAIPSTNNYRDPNTILYDGADLIQATLPIAVTRFAFPDNPGSLMAGAVEVFNQDSWGDRFIAPVGEDTTSSTNAFEYSVFYVMAGDDGTELFLNGSQLDVNGTDPGFGVLNIGDNFVIEGLQEGDELTSSRPVQVDLVTGDIGDTYELRWYAQVDADEWSNEYITPVAEEAGSTGYWFHNPSNTQITISYEGGNSPNGSFNVAANSSEFIEVDSNGDINLNNGDTFAGNQYSGLRFFTEASNNSGSTPNFYALAQVDADDGGQIFDWGFPLIQTDQLTSQVLVGLGRGATDDGLPLNDQGEESRSVVWVTPIENSNIFIDFDGDGTFDYNESVNALNSLRIVDDTVLFSGAEGDQDLTGAIIVSNTSADSNGQPNGTPVSIAAVWGQDPPRSLSGDGEALDLGTAIVPLANPAINKEAVSVTNPDGTTDSDGIVDQVGDVINYEIAVSNAGFQDLTGVVVTDPLLANLSDPVESINNDGILQRGETWTYTGSYTVQQSDIDSNGGGDGDIDNIATVDTDQTPPSSDSEEVLINLSSISGNVSEDIDNDDTGDINLQNVTVELLDDQGTVIRTTTTDTDGNYEFTDLEAGDYTVRQVNLAGYSDVSDTDPPNDNLISVTLPGDVDSTGNDFVDEQIPFGSISGTVEDDQGNPLSGVTVELFDENNNPVDTITTGEDGSYTFNDVEPG
ncbi:MAG: carboxypeptidase regulatory-like domain-containing protein, partial [Trichodesmium sp. MO_231.B1]|nr:carboxypeptidase regulatory-like domain-containing protein [Trichodesmium sp. MO_231.B1]